MGKKKKQKIGLLPGSLVYTGKHVQEKSTLHWIQYGAESILGQGSHLPSFPLTPAGSVLWLQVTGLSDTEYIGKIGQHFNLHALTLEDILNANARPKFEDHNHYLFCDLKLFSQGEEIKVALILLQDVVISFCEKESTINKVVEERIVNGMGRIRRKHADYLFYSMIDLVVDHFQMVRDELEEQIDSLEENLDQAVKPIHHLLNLQKIRSRIIKLRRSSQALKEITNTIVRNDSALLEEGNDPYYRDLWDHALHASEDLREMQERVKSTIEIAISLNSFNMNNIIKRLTTFTSIFMPLTFISGLYGMNFSYMPLLQETWGFWLIITLMFSVATAMAIVARRKRWF